MAKNAICCAFTFAATTGPFTLSQIAGQTGNMNILLQAATTTVKIAAPATAHANAGSVAISCITNAVPPHFRGVHSDTVTLTAATGDVVYLFGEMMSSAAEGSLY